MARSRTRKHESGKRIHVRVVNPPEDTARLLPTEPIRNSVNAILFLALILFCGLWTWLYSDWFAAFSGTVGLTVLLGAVPTLRSFMTSDHNDKWSGWIDTLLFKSRLATLLYPVLLAIVLIVGFGLYQPVAIRSAEAASDVVTVTMLGYPDASERTTRMQLEPDRTQRQPVRRPILGGPDRIVVKARALPIVERSLRGLPWKSLVFPLDFWAEPSILLHPAPSILADLRDRRHDLQLTLRRGGEDDVMCLVQEDYLGEPVWLGTKSRALPVSDHIQNAWREQANLHGLRRGPADLEAYVIATPISPDCLTTLEAGDVVEWALLGSGGSPLQQGSVTIGGAETYPLEIAMEGAS